MSTYAPIVTTHTKGWILDYQTFCDGSPVGLPLDRYVTLRSETPFRLLPESRPYPVPLFGAFTDRPNQGVTLTTAGVQTLFQNTGYTCYKEPGHIPVPGGAGRKYTSLRMGSNDSVVPAWPDPDWITPLRNQVNDLSISLGQDLAEYRSTADTFHNLAVGARDAWQWWRKKKRALRNLNMSDVAAADIIYGFGISPLIGLFDDSLNMLYGQLSEPTHVKLTQSARETVRFSATNSVGVKFNGYKTLSKRAKVFIKFKRPPPAYQFGNAASIAWELVPYSFLFDYMIPVGDYLSAIDAMVDVENVIGTVTRRYDGYTECWQKQPTDPSITVMDETPGSYATHSTGRSVVIEIPTPPFPKWKPSASWHKLRHAVALLVLSRNRA